MKKIILASLMVSGCMASWDVIEAKRSDYYGQPIEVMVAKFGPPAASGELNERVFYTWTNSPNMVFSTPQYNTAVTSGTYGSLGGGYGTYSGTTGYTTYQTNSVQLNCTFTVYTSEGVIVDMQAAGNNGACQAYSSRL